MKILFLTPYLSQYQAQTFWLKAVRQLKAGVTVHQYTDQIIYPPSRVDRKFPQFSPEFWLRNYKIYKTFESDKFDYVFFSSGTPILSPQLIQYMSQKSKIVVFNGTEPRSFFNARERAMVPYVHLAVTNDFSHADQWRKMGVRQAITLPISAIDPDFHRTPANVKKDIPVSFIGTFTDERQAQTERLLPLVPSLQIWGPIPPETVLKPQLTSAYRGYPVGQDYLNILRRSKISLNLLVKSMPNGANLKMFEIPAARALQITNNPKQSWFMPDEIVTVSDGDYPSIAKLVKYYLTHESERKKIVNKAYTSVMHRHNYFHRFSRLISSTLRLGSSTALGRCSLDGRGSFSE